MMRQLEIEPEKFRPQYKVHTIFTVSGGKNKGRLGFQKKSLDLVSGLVD